MPKLSLFETLRQLYNSLKTQVDGKASKVASATNGHFVSLDTNGELADSGKAASDFAPASGSTNYAAASHTHTVSQITDLQTITTSEIDSLFVTLISFTIDGTTYQAESGMTWAEWVASEYSAGSGAGVPEGYDDITGGGGNLRYSNGNPVYRIEEIVANEAYYFDD